MDYRVDFNIGKTVNLEASTQVTGDNDQSYSYFMNHNLFDHISINKETPVSKRNHSEIWKQRCGRYEQVVASMGGVDVQLLGIGNNGHIAFNDHYEEFPEKTHIW